MLISLHRNFPLHELLTTSIRYADHFLWKWLKLWLTFSIAIVKTEYEYFTIDWRKYVAVDQFAWCIICDWVKMRFFAKLPLVPSQNPRRKRSRAWDVYQECYRSAISRFVELFRLPSWACLTMKQTYFL